MSPCGYRPCGPPTLPGSPGDAGSFRPVSGALLAVLVSTSIAGKMMHVVGPSLLWTAIGTSSAQPGYYPGIVGTEERLEVRSHPISA